MLDRKSLNRMLISLYVAIVFAIGVAALWVISDIAANQSYKQQQAISPVFTVIEQELLEPMHIAKTLATAKIYDKYFLDDNLTDPQILSELTDLENLFGLGFYIAKEKNRKQYNSNGSSFDLIEGKVGWYFELQSEPRDFLAVLGQREDVHLYIDVKQYNAKGKFIGFVGVSKSLQAFLDSFEKFRQAYGHEFVFTNTRGEIVLSSKAELLAENLKFKNVDILPWYEQFLEGKQSSEERSKLVPTDDGDLLISQVIIEALDWKLYVITPLSERQSELNKTFIFYVALLFLFLVVFYKVTQYITRQYLRTLDQKVNYDPLTKLSNRNHLEFRFNALVARKGQIGFIVMNLNNFKRINEIYGHNAGDKVLHTVGQQLKLCLGKQAVAGRWSADEFLILLPETTPERALVIAKRCKKMLSALTIQLSKSSIEISASFGVTTATQNKDFNAMLDVADKALDKAKHDVESKIYFLSSD
ncbi:sensor domain-containing diguanylate cyclase [Alteromonadaceae bacterium BrNp21-10]|nr:sensor domain-containing diguanylate cyclase [Alteromonadaceae bacterium BrNp21-10]